MSPAALELEDVSASYGPYRALFGVSLTVEEAGALALVGPNGAGKSTVARVATGLLAPSGGRVRVAGRDLTGSPAWRLARAGVAHVPEGRGIFASLSVEENLVLAVRRRARGRAASAALERAYGRFPVLGQRRGERAGTLSGGQQRLLSLAKTLVVPPRVLVADELSLGLAPSVVDEVYDGLAELEREGTALVVVDQQVRRAALLASSAVVLDHGVVAFTGPAAEAPAAMERLLAARSWAPSSAGGP